ncbi:MAG: hypothetical protein IT531_04090 [Burkholderiales bacterium]|nr:hypothetical protein [Burkholderiales bacterium]
MRCTTGIAAAALLLGVTGCEGLFTGARELTQPLHQTEDGSFAPVTLTLAPEMNPIAFNLHGSIVANPLQSGRWNAYRAELSRDGMTLASGHFTVNNAGQRGPEPATVFAQTILYASVAQAGEYRLTITSTQPKEVTIESPRIEVRRNTQPPPK